MSSAYNWLVAVTNTLVACSAISLTSSLGGVTCRGSPLFFNWHILLCIIAVSLTMTASIFFSLFLSNRTKSKTLHRSMNLLSLALMLVGVVVAILAHSDNEKPHFSTVHSWMGLSTVVLMSLQAGTAVIAWDVPCLTLYKARAWLHRSHSAMGTNIITLAVVSLITGVVSKQKNMNLENSYGRSMANYLAVVTLAMMFVTLSMRGGKNLNKKI